MAHPSAFVGASRCVCVDVVSVRVSEDVAAPENCRREVFFFQTPAPPKSMLGPHHGGRVEMADPVSCSINIERGVSEGV